MNKKPIFAVLGAGNGGLAAAADISTQGFKVNLWEHPDFVQNITPLMEIGGINLEVLPSNPLKEGFAKLELITTDISKALEDADVVMIIVPSFAHKSFAEFCIPYLKDNQIVVLMPGNFGGALEFYNVYKKIGNAKNVVFAEAECLMYSCRKKDPKTIWIRGYKKGLRFAAVPATENDRVMNLIQQVYPYALPGKSIIETGLSNPNPVLHTPIMVLNTGLIDRKEDFLFYMEGLTPSITRIAEVMDEERMAIANVLKTKTRSICDQDKEWYGYQGAVGNNIYETTINNTIFEWSKAPDTFQHRYLTEDIPFGLAVIEELGLKTGVPTPITTAMINLSEILVGRDLRKERRSLEQLGLADKSVEEIVNYINKGI